MLPTPLNVTLMVTGYLLVMGYLALGLRILRRAPRARPREGSRGWPGLLRRVLGTVTGGSLLLLVVIVAYYHGVARLGGRFLASAFTGSATLLGVTLPVYFLTSWAVVRRQRRRGPAGGQR
ncbi:hypothetical protein LHJ74_05110 [Streptomyces sp. N2-109]|uniref:Integral membrane protein n=1 Tax=Streptomyces gossypii TaxID=2883101 RepID=A0ABT2JN60_9ACTN|nr:DUF6256 family protein [Streptomyces gossypii]MCT2589318.1 hypothetical protein [Streptomyces gossypii]